VGTTPDEAGTDAPSTDPGPPPTAPVPVVSRVVPPASPDEGAVESAGTPSSEPAGTPTASPRQALRATRRHRRRIWLGCAVLITVCLVITLLIVGLARDRPAPPQGLSAAGPGLGVAGGGSPLSLIPSITEHDAAASRGGNP
jgi:hypothetical protein